jgi:hypothetical protein
MKVEYLVRLPAAMEPVRKADITGPREKWTRELAQGVEVKVVDNSPYETTDEAQKQQPQKACPEVLSGRSNDLVEHGDEYSDVAMAADVIVVVLCYQ